jgi:hypothetical protein
MSSKLSAKLLVLALLFVALPQVASASSARVEGLGLQNDYVMDYTNVFVYPSLVGQYQNLVYGDLGRKDVTGGSLSDFQDNNQATTNDANRAMGAILGNLWGGKAGVWSLHFNENATPMSAALGAQYFNRNANEAFDLIWGYKFQKMSLGIALNKSYSSEELQNGTIIFRPFSPGGNLTTVTQFNTRQFYNLIASAVGAQDWNSTGVGAGGTFDLGGGDKPRRVRSFALAVVGAVGHDEREQVRGSGWRELRRQRASALGQERGLPPHAGGELLPHGSGHEVQRPDGHEQRVERRLRDGIRGRPRRQLEAS